MSEKVSEYTKFRASLVEGRYQAQVQCPVCESWVLTTNLELHKDDEGNLVAEAVDVICMKQTVPACGFELGDIRLVGWQHSAPVNWRKDTSDAD